MLPVVLLVPLFVVLFTPVPVVLFTSVPLVPLSDAPVDAPTPVELSVDEFPDAGSVVCAYAMLPIANTEATARVDMSLCLELVILVMVIVIMQLLGVDVSRTRRIRRDGHDARCLRMYLVV